jgi:hypothetical protein
VRAHGRCPQLHERAPKASAEEVEIVARGGGVEVGGAAGIGRIGDQGLEHGTAGRGIGGSVSEETPGQPVVGQGDGGDPGGIVRFGIAQPAQLRGGEGGDGQDPGAGDEVLGSDLGDEVSGRGLAAQIVPQQSIADDRPSASRATSPCC